MTARLVPDGCMTMPGFTGFNHALETGQVVPVPCQGEKDWGNGQPVVFSHGWPLSADAWEDQMLFLASRGYRCIVHDRRGHGRSSQP